MGNLVPRSQRQRAFLGSSRLVKIAHLARWAQTFPQQAGLALGRCYQPRGIRWKVQRTPLPELVPGAGPDSDGETGASLD